MTNIRDLRWLEQPNAARFEEHTPENAGPGCRENCVGHYVWEARLINLGEPTIIRTLKEPD